MQACAIRQHQECTVHGVAKSLFLSPDRPVSELLPYDLKDQDLFRGNVPQPADWLRAWSACKRVTSFRSAAQHSRPKTMHGEGDVLLWPKASCLQSCICYSLLGHGFSPFSGRGFFRKWT